MKIKLLCLFLFLGFSLEAQPPLFTTAPHTHFNSTTNKIIKASTGQYFVIGALGATISKYVPHLYCIRDSGNILFEKTLFAGSTTSRFDVTDIIKTADNNFVCVGHGDVCDAPGISEVFVEKFDIAGNTIWFKKYDMPANFDKSQHIVELPNGGFAFTVNNEFMFLNSSGDTLSSHTMGAPLLSMAATPDNYLLLGFPGSLEKIDLSGNSINSKTYTSAASKIIVNNSNEYIFCSGAVMYRTDSMFNVIDSVDLQFSINPIYDIEADVSGFHLLGISKMIQVNDNFVADTLSYTYSGYQINDILVDGNTLLVAGDEYVKNSPNFILNVHPVIKSFDINYQTEVETNDASVIDISSDSINVILTPFTSWLHMNLYATVQNNGPDTLTEVSLNFQVHPPAVMCDAYDITSSVSGFIIAPNDTGTVYIGAYVFEKHLSPPNQFNICVWSSAPNNRIDVDHSNDQFCKSFNPNFITAIEENNSLTNISIYPNPASNQLQFTNLDHKSVFQYSITDLSGKEYLNGSFDSDNNSISLNELQSGLYFVKLESEKGMVVKKICKM